MVVGFREKRGSQESSISGEGFVSSLFQVNGSPGSTRKPTVWRRELLMSTTVPFGRRRNLKRGVQIRVAYNGRVFVEWPSGPDGGMELVQKNGSKICDGYRISITNVSSKGKCAHLEVLQITRARRRRRFRSHRSIEFTMPAVMGDEERDPEDAEARE